MTKEHTPILTCVPRNILVKFNMINSSLLITHGDSILNSLCQFFRIPRIHNNTSIQTLSSSRKFTQYHHAMTLLLSTNIFVGDKVHAISCTAHKTDIADVVQGYEFGKVNGL